VEDVLSRRDHRAQRLRASSTRETHHDSIQVKWTGNRGDGTSSYRAHDRAHEIVATGKPTMVPELRASDR